jgi:hypothetical protein
MNTFIKIMPLLLIGLSGAHADSIYKSVDENGRVTYSSTPPESHKEIEKINIAPPPSEAEIQAAKQRHEKNLEAAGTMDETRKKRNEITAEENRIKSERQKQMQKQTQKKESNDSPAYPYYYPRYPGVIVPPAPDRPVIDRPIERPIQLPAQGR